MTTAANFRLLLFLLPAGPAGVAVAHAENRQKERAAQKLPSNNIISFQMPAVPFAIPPTFSAVFQTDCGL